MTVTGDGFEELFEREYPRLVRALRRADDDATDAVQEAFVQAYARWNRVSKLDDPAGWVRRVAVNRLFNARRSRGRRDAAVERLAARSTPTVASFGADDRLDTIAAVRQLAPQQRVAVALFYGADLSVHEVADAMQLSEGTVKSHLHDARDRLRQVLSELPSG
jgi:RNA polymerase sigma-70 factor, ECF subfamily